MADGPTPEHPTRITQKDVMEKAGVRNPATVSSILRGSSQHSPIKEQVLTAAKELGYVHFPKRKSSTTLERGMRLEEETARSRIGIIVPSVANPVYGSPVEYVQQYASGSDKFDVVLREVPFGTPYVDVETAVKQLDRQGVSSIVLIDKFVPSQMAPGLIRPDRPMVTIEMGHAPSLTEQDRRIQPEGLIRVEVGTEGLEEAMTYLYNQGHREFLYLSGLQSILGKQYQAYHRMREKLGLSEPNNIEGGKTYRGAMGLYDFSEGYHAVKELPTPQPTAFIVDNDQTALGVIRGLQDKGLSVPGDVSVVGFGNSQLSDYTNPRLSTIRINDIVPYTLSDNPLGSYITNLIVDPLWTGREQKLGNTAVKTTFVKRESVGPAPSAPK